MSNSEDQNQLNVEQQPTEMSLQEWIQVIEENREELLEQVMKIEGEEEMDLDDETQTTSEWLSTNPVAENLIKIAEEEMGKWRETLVTSKFRLLLELRVLVSFGVDSHEVLQVLGFIQELEDQADDVMDALLCLSLLKQFCSLVNTPEHKSDWETELADIDEMDKKMISDVLKLELSDLLRKYADLIEELVGATEHMHDDDEDEFDM